MEQPAQVLVISIVHLTKTFTLESISFIILALLSIIRFWSLQKQQYIQLSELALLTNLSLCMYFSDSYISYFIVGQMTQIKELKNLIIIFFGIHSQIFRNFELREMFSTELIILILIISFYTYLLNQNKPEREKSMTKIDLQNNNDYSNRPDFKIKLIEQSSINSQLAQQKDLIKDLLQFCPNGVMILNDNLTVQQSNLKLQQLLKENDDSRLLSILKQAKNILPEDNQSYDFYQSCYLSFNQRTNLFKNQEILKMSKYDTLGQEISHQFQKLVNSDQIVQTGTSHIISASQIIVKTNGVESNNFSKSLTQKSSVYTKPPFSFFEIYLDVIIVNLVDEGHQQVILFITDISNLNKLHILKQLNHNKSKLLRSVCHEIRNPLNCMQLISNYLKDQIPKELQEQCIEPINLSITMLLNLVNDLLDVAQINSGKFQLEIKQFDLKKLLEQVKRLTHFYFQEKGLKCIISTNIQFISSDEKRIRQILINLIQNALKFTQKGKIQINVNIQRENYVKFEVSDTGIGIQKDNIDKLFKVFGKLQDNQNLNKEGVGLGLQISNILCQNLSTIDKNKYMSGLQVESDGVGQGSRFSFIIYDHRMDQQDETVGILVSAKIDSKNDSEDENPQIYNFSSCDCKEILIVDDEQYNLKMLQLALQKHNLKVDTAISGQDAYEKVLTFPCFDNCGCKNYKIILMDIDMPEMDGCETAQKIKQDFSFDQILIYGCSGFGKTQKDICLRAGMDGYFEKPIKVNEILGIISEIKLQQE